MKEPDVALREWIKANATKTDTATELGISRPTLNKYIELYDSGRAGEIPPDVKEYFDRLLAGSDKSRLCEEQIILEEIKELKKKYIEVEELFTRTREGIIKDELKLKNLESAADPPHQEIAILKREILENESVCKKMSLSLNEMDQALNCKYKQLAEYEKSGSIRHESSKEYRVKSVCYQNDGKFVLFHTSGSCFRMAVESSGAKNCEPVYRLELLVKVEDEYVPIGMFRPVEGKDYFVVDDVFPFVPKYYNILTYALDHEDPEIEHSGYDVDTMIGLDWLPVQCSTGICELRQQRWRSLADYIAGKKGDADRLARALERRTSKRFEEAMKMDTRESMDGKKDDADGVFTPSKEQGCGKRWNDLRGSQE